MKMHDENTLRELAVKHGQEHLFRFWDRLNEQGRAALLHGIGQVDFPLVDTLVNTWVLQEPPPEIFDTIVPVPVIRQEDPQASEAVAAGEDALRRGKVACFVVAGGQGTRLGFDGPKGSYPIGPITGHTLFQYHAEKILALQRRYDTVLPWYVMVSPANGAATRAFFESNQYFGLHSGDVLFCEQRMTPCVDGSGKIILEALDRLAMSPNGHGGSVQALVDGGALADAERRGVEILSYFQVDNWAVKVADPLFIGHHVLRGGEMSSKCHRRNDLREAVGVHCLCDGAYRVIEYSEIDLYPQLLATDENGAPAFFAGNPAIHLINAGFVRKLYDRFDQFPWHKAFKKIPFVNDDGVQVKPPAPNGYKFETFIFDALRFVGHPPVALEIGRQGEYTPIKEYEGVNSVVAARQSMADYWSPWFDGAGFAVPRNCDGACAVPLEVSPVFALDSEAFRARAAGMALTVGKGAAVLADGVVMNA